MTVSSASLLDVILAGHGAACGLFGLLIYVLWRDRAGSAVGKLSLLLLGGAAANAVASTPGFQPGAAAWQLPLLVLAWGNPAVFLVWAWAAFDDKFRPRPWHVLPWLALAGGWSSIAYGGRHVAAAQPVLGSIVPLLALGFAIAAAVPILTTWRSDLVGDRRSLRLVVLLGIVADITVGSAADIAPQLRLPGVWSGEIVDTAAQCALAFLASGYLLQVDRTQGAAALLPASDDAAADTTAAAPAAPAAGPVPDPVLLRRLDHVMSAERAYREEGLTIGRLANRLQVPEYRLRQAINEGLGHRNFNVFLNRYRIEDAKSALGDPDQAEVPILTIAMDAGFQSVGPFNRAFKTDTGMTPTEYRRRCLAEMTTKPFKSHDNAELGKVV